MAGCGMVSTVSHWGRGGSRHGAEGEVGRDHGGRPRHRPGDRAAHGEAGPARRRQRLRRGGGRGGGGANARPRGTATETQRGGGGGAPKREGGWAGGGGGAPP